MKTFNKFFAVNLLALMSVFFMNSDSNADVYTFTESLSGLEEVPPNASTGTGLLTGTYDDGTNALSFNVSFSGLSAGTTAAHFHGPAAVGVNAGVQIGFTGFPTAVTSGVYNNNFILTASQETDFLAGLWYVNVHTTALPGGELRSQLNPAVILSANVYAISETLSGLEEVPPNASPGSGLLTGTYNDGTNVLSFSVSFSGLTANTTAAHFHGPAAVGVNAGVQIGFTGFPTGVTGGVYINNFVLTASQESDLLANLWYVNIHSSIFPGGEIRSQLFPDIVLPVELSSFTSVISGNDVILNWTTAAEINNSGFDIERKSNGLVWDKIGFVSGQGNSNEIHSYIFTDNDLNTGVYNYRLKQIDLNGNFEYFNLSNEVNIGVPADFDLSQNYPNPFNPETKIDFTIPENGNVSLQLYDYTGRLVKTLFGGFKSAGYYSYKLNASDISSGIYFYKLESGNQSITKKLMLVK